MRDPGPDVSADQTRLRGQARDLSASARWPLNLDAFWPVLAVVLVVAVIFVASVAHSSMNQVGVLVVRSSAQLPPRPTATTVAGPIMVVQASSHTTRSAAQAAAEELIGRGYRAKVLKSDGYRPLNRGYYVVYVGPYSTTTTGRAAAAKVQARLPGALVRNLVPR